MKTERRLGPRYIKRIPMQVAIAKRNLSQSYSTATMNISRSGLYFATDLPLREGTELELRLNVPKEMKSLPAIECKFIARVAHVERMGNGCPASACIFYTTLLTKPDRRAPTANVRPKAGIVATRMRATGRQV